MVDNGARVIYEDDSPFLPISPHLRILCTQEVGTPAVFRAIANLPQNHKKWNSMYSVKEKKCNFAQRSVEGSNARKTPLN